MKERPLLFSAPMVTSLLAGTKTQTRRIAKAATDPDGTEFRDADGWPMRDTDAGEVRAGCPFGAAGDRIWVKETHGIVEVDHDEVIVAYRADQRGQFVALKPGPEAVDWATSRVDGDNWRPSIFMPRWASRITLEITGVRVERLNEISRGDVMAEGCPFPNMAQGDDPRQWYAELWDQINGAGACLANPWIWVLTFRRVRS